MTTSTSQRFRSWPARLASLLPFVLTSCATTAPRTQPEAPTTPIAQVAPVEPASAPVVAPVSKTWPPAQPTAAEVAITKSDRLVAVRVGTIDSDNPYAETWKQAPYFETPLLAQQMTMPAIEGPTVEALRVQAQNDGTRIAFRLSWKDPTPDGNVDAARFTDAVAVEFPLVAGAAPMMGHAGAKVQILHWKALWQKDLDVGFQDVQDLHPNYWSDLYWFAEGKFPFPVQTSFANPSSLQWFIAQSAGNPMAVFSRTQPVEELIAEGFGTLTHQKESASSGKGAWVDGTWAVVISRPLKTQDTSDYQFDAAQKGQVAFAVWQGAAGNVGGRKNWTAWNELEVAP